MITYVMVDGNLQDPNDIKANIVLIDQIISQLLNTALKAALNGDTVEYTLDTGQTKIHKTYNNPKAITDAIMNYRRIRQTYVSMLTSRITRLVDSKNFNNGFYGR